MEILNITEIKRIFILTTKVNCQSYAYISEVAKEMGIRKTTLMQFIEDNPKLFHLIEPSVKKSKGLAISHIFLKPEDNPDTDEYLEVKKEEWAKKIKVFEINYYGSHEFYYLAVDGDERKCLWRNTPAKIQTLIDEGLIKNMKSGYGGWGDYSNWEGLLLTPEAEKAITEAGWELVF